MSLAAGAVHIWLAELDTAADALLGTLSPCERERAASFVREGDGIRWARSRAILRALLGRYLRVGPSGIGFELSAHGKPAIAQPRAARWIAFNLSHSGPLALYAFAHSDVGVDIQLAPSRARDYVALARRAFGVDAAQRLQRLAPDAREREFLRSWTRHEAALKCHGASTWKPAGGPCPRPGGASGLWVTPLDLNAAAAAVAVEGPPSEVRCFAWTG
jgi:4'-phosphopantetheinyl transferase